MDLPEITIIRNKDFFQNSYQYINFLLDNFDFSQDTLKIQKHLWILDAKITLSEIENGIQDDKNNPKSHFDVLKNDLFGIDLYLKDKNKFIQEQNDRKFIFEHLTEIDYSQLPFSLSNDEIEEIIEKLNSLNMKPFDILSPLNGGQILLEKILMLENSILSTQEQSELKNNVNAKADELAKQQVNQEIEILNKTRETALKEIEKLISNSSFSYFLYYFPSSKNLNDFVGFKKSGGGYKQKIYEYSNGSWQEMTHSPLNILPVLDNSLEKDNLKDFRLYEVGFDEQLSQYYINKTYSYYDIEDKEKYDKNNNLFKSTYFLFEKKFGVGDREQYESMKQANPPDIKQMLIEERKNTNDLRNLLISKLHGEF